jgi:hypothetical protein
MEEIGGGTVGRARCRGRCDISGACDGRDWEASCKKIISMKNGNNSKISDSTYLNINADISIRKQS